MLEFLYFLQPLFLFSNPLDSYPAKFACHLHPPPPRYLLQQAFVRLKIPLQLLAEAWLLKTVRLRVFLTSRPGVLIRYGFCQMSETEHRDFVLHNISPSIIHHDITIFLEYNLRLIGEERCSRRRLASCKSHKKCAGLLDLEILYVFRLLKSVFGDKESHGEC
jgi:hypothetical protein